MAGAQGRRVRNEVAKGAGTARSGLGLEKDLPGQGLFIGGNMV